MDNCISSSNIATNVSIQGSNQQIVSSPIFSADMWRNIAALSSSDTVVSMREASRGDSGLLSAINSLEDRDDLTELTNINNHPDSTVDLYRFEGEIHAVTKDHADRLEMASDQNISPALQYFLAKSGSGDIAMALARNPGLTSERAQETLTETIDRNWGFDILGPIFLRRELARNASLTSEVAINRLASSDDHNVRAALAGSVNAGSEEIQNILAGDAERRVRRALRNNTDITLTPEANQILDETDAADDTDETVMTA